MGKGIADIPTGEEIKGSINAYLDSRFLSSNDIAGFGDVAVEIERCVLVRTLKFENGNVEENAKLLYFKGKKKPLVLNKTNARELIRLAKSANVQDWHEMRVVLYTIEGHFFGKQQLALRIKGEGE